jgi:hypothetical protein
MRGINLVRSCAVFAKAQLRTPSICSYRKRLQYIDCSLFKVFFYLEVPFCFIERSTFLGKKGTQSFLKGIGDKFMQCCT